MEYNKKDQLGKRLLSSSGGSGSRTSSATMNDRLAELKKGAPQTIDVDDANETAATAQGQGGAQSEAMRQFFADVELVKKNIVVIKQAAKRIGDISQQVGLTTTSEREKELSNELSPLVSETNKKAAYAKNLLQRIREETEKLSKSGSTNPEIRIRENLTNTLTRKFVDVMKDYQNVQQKFKTDIKKKVKRQVQIVKPDATSEEIDAVLKSGGGSGEVFKNAILKGDAADSIKNAFVAAADKYQDVLTLEASVNELHQMFLDFALLTEQQGDLLDKIEEQVKHASEYIDDGNTDLVSAIELQKSIRRKQCCVICTVLVVIGVIIIIVLATQSDVLSSDSN